MKTNSILFEIFLLGATVLACPATLEAQYMWTTNDNAITITAYTGPGGSVTIPSTITGLPVTGIAQLAFANSSVANVTIPTSVTTIEAGAFVGCNSLMAFNVIAPNPDYASAGGVLFDSTQTTLVEYPGGLAGPYTVPAGVITIGELAFANCSRLTTVTIGSNVASLVDYAFAYCSSLSGIYFQGDAPALGSEVFSGDSATVYYLTGTTGWGTTFGGLPAELLSQATQITGIAVQNNEFGFTFNGTNGQVIVVQASTNLADPNWQPIQTNTLNGPSFKFTDSQPATNTSRFYRVSTLSQ